MNILRPRWKKTLADLWENKSRTLLVIASLYVGVFSVGQIAVGYTAISRGMRETYAKSRPANIQIVTSPFEKDLVKAIEDKPYIAHASARRSIYVQSRALSEQDWLDMEVVAIQDFQNPGVKELTLLEGVTPPPENAIHLLEETRAELGIRLNDILEVRLLDDTIRQMPVAGITKDYSMGIESISNPNFGFISEDTLEHLHAPRSFNTLYLTVTRDKDNLDYIQDIGNQVKDQIEMSGRPVYFMDTFRASEHPYGNYVNAIAAVFSFLGIFTLILSSFLVSNTMNALMALQVRHIGVMKLVGATRKQVVSSYITLVLILGLTALFFSIPSAAYVGVAIGKNTVESLNGALVEISPIPMMPIPILLQVLVAILMPLGAALFPVLRGSSVTVKTALRGSLILGAERDGVIDKLLGKARNVQGIPLLSLRNTLRKKGRVLLTLSTLALGGAMFIAVFNVQVSMDQHIDRIISYASADVFLEMGRRYPIDEINQYVQSIPGVSGVEAWQITGAKLSLPNNREEIVTLLAPPDSSVLVSPVAHQGRWISPTDKNAIVVNEAFANSIPGVAVGNTMALEVNGVQSDWKIVGIFQYTGMDQYLAYTNYASLSNALHVKTRTSSFRIITDHHGLEYQVQKAQEIDCLLSDMGYDVVRVTGLYDRVEESVEKLEIVVSVLLILATLTGIVGGIGLSGTLSLNVLERTSEIGILRAIGAHDRIVAMLVLIEGMIIGLTSYIVGVAASFPITKALGGVVNQAIFRSAGDFALTPKGFIIWFGVVVSLSVVASLIPARSATRMTIREVLAYE